MSEATRQVGVSGPGPRGFGEALDRSVPVGDEESQRRTDRDPGPETTEHLHRIGLDLLAPAPAEPALPELQASVDPHQVESDPLRDSLEDHRQARAVRLACRTPGQASHGAIPPSPDGSTISGGRRLATCRENAKMSNGF